MHRLTRVTVHAPELPRTAQEVGVRGLRFRESAIHLLELTFDDGRQGTRLDLRPGLPLILHY